MNGTHGAEPRRGRAHGTGDADLGLVRGSALSGFRELVTELAGDPDSLLRGAGIDPSAVGRPDQFLSHWALIHVLEAAAETTGTPDLGRRLAQRQNVDILGPVVPAARAARTFADALTLFQRFLPTYTTASTLEVLPLPDERLVLFELRTEPTEGHRYPQVTELSLQLTLNVFRLLLGPSFRPVRVHLPHEALSPRADYVRDYCAPPLFEEPHAGFTLGKTDLARPLEDAPLTHEALVHYLDSTLLPDRTGHVRVVRELVQQLLPRGTPTVERVADLLGLHQRVLQRRLVAEGVSFTELVDDVRRDTAERLLTETELPLGLVTRRLGYAEQSALSRACRRWFGTAPTAVRRAAQREHTRTAEDNAYTQRGDGPRT